jgi:hypothetical protein
MIAMTNYTTILGNVLSLGVLALDVTAFFLAVRIVTLMQDASWLRSFRQRGRAMMNGYTGWVERRWTRFHLQPLSSRGAYIIGLLILELVRLILVCIIGLLSGRPGP